MVSVAKAIKSTRDKIPLDRFAEPEAKITEYYNVSSLTDEVLEKALTIGKQSVNEVSKSHGFKVVQFYAQKCGLVKLERLWRKHFIV